MANKFTQSVFQRLEQEAAEQKAAKRRQAKGQSAPETKRNAGGIQEENTNGTRANLLEHGEPFQSGQAPAETLPDTPQEKMEQNGKGTPHPSKKAAPAAERPQPEETVPLCRAAADFHAKEEPVQDTGAFPVSNPASASGKEGYGQSPQETELAVLKGEGGVDLSRFLPQKPERTACNKTYYLDKEVIDAVHRAAKARRMADSKLVNSILRTVLGMGEN